MSTHAQICKYKKYIWEEELEGLEAWLKLHDTNSDILTCIMHTLWTRSPMMSFTMNVTSTILHTANEQDEIGWHNLLQGRISK
jgi:hypothetical protein